MNKNVLTVTDLRVTHGCAAQVSSLVKGVSFSVGEGECIGIMGRSGSGKSLMVKGILGLLGESFQVSGNLVLKDKPLSLTDKTALSKVRGRQVAMILQNPMTCFDPLYTIESQIKETLLAYRQNEVPNRETIISLLERVHIHQPEQVLKKYPHELSGGMLQRIMVGLSLANEPDLLIADEPTTAIDAVNAVEIMKMLSEVKKAKKTGIIFISHDLSVISKVADRILVMDEGQIVDQGDLNYLLHESTYEKTRNLVDVKVALVRQYNQLVMGRGIEI